MISQKLADFAKKTGITIREGGDVKQQSAAKSDTSNPMHTYYGMHYYNTGKMPPVNLNSWVIFYQQAWRCV